MTEQLENIVKTITLNANIDKVWQIVTSADQIEKWFMPNDFSPIVGHEFHIQSPFGPSPCKVEAVDKPHFVRFSWDTDGWYVTFELEEIGEQTKFTLTHGGWKNESHITPKAGMSAESVRKNMDGGWTMLIEHKLKQYVEYQ